MAVLTLWVLGAPDTEMSLIEQLLERCGQRYVHATKGGQRATQANAYEADRLDLTNYQDLLCVTCVECSVSFNHFSAGLQVFDHHRPQSMGFDRPAAEALAASSLGQTLCWLSLLFGDRGEIPPFGWPDIGAHPHRSRSGIIGTALSGGELCCRGRWLQVPDELRYTAAADHCLAAAYRGEVPGVEPQTLLRWRAETRATAERPAQQILKDMELARDYLQSQIQQGRVRYYHADGSPPTRCARGNGQSEAVVVCEVQMPELPEAAALEGLAVLYSANKGSAKHWVLRGARPSTVRCWMQRQRDEGRRTNGVPELGYASVAL